MTNSILKHYVDQLSALDKKRNALTEQINALKQKLSENEQECNAYKTAISREFGTRHGAQECESTVHALAYEATEMPVVCYTEG